VGAQCAAIRNSIKVRYQSSYCCGTDICIFVLGFVSFSVIMLPEKLFRPLCDRFAVTEIGQVFQSKKHLISCLGQSFTAIAFDCLGVQVIYHLFENPNALFFFLSSLSIRLHDSFPLRLRNYQMILATKQAHRTQQQEAQAQ